MPNPKQRTGQGPDLQLVTVPIRPLLNDTWAEVSPHLGDVLRMEPQAREEWLADLKGRDPALAKQIHLYIAELADLLREDDDTWGEVSTHLGKALRIEPVRRNEWFDELKVSHPDLAGQVRLYVGELAEILRGDRDGLVSQPRPDALGPVDALDAPKAGLPVVLEWAPGAGQKLGPYTLDRTIGHGGMGTVWLASRSDGRFEGQVAIKLMNAAVRAHVSGEHITREGQILAKLSHPNIARLIDAGVTVQGQPYLVLDYVDGEDIDRWCNSNQLSIEERIHIFLDVLAAVQHAHNQLILHRDLKPSNVLVTAKGEVKLLDFGIGKLLDGGPFGPDSPSGRNTTLFCTPAYAAPEQVQSGHVSTTATDVYALGVMLYVLLAGRHPTAGTGSTPLEQMKAVVEEDAPLLSSMAVSTVPQLPGFAPVSRRTARRLRGDLDNILAKALRKSPSERYASVAEFGDDLRRYLDHKPVYARPSSTGYRLRKFIRRHRGPVVTGVAVLLALLGGVAATTWQALEASKARTLAEGQRLAAEEERAEAQFEARNARASQELLSQIFGDAVKGGEDSRMRARLDRARDLLSRRYSQDPRIYANLLLQLAGRYNELGDQERSAQVMREFNRLSASTGDGSLQANAECIEAYALVGAGQAQEAEGHLARGFDFMHQVRQDWAEAGSECYRADAMLAVGRGDHARAASQMRTWLKILDDQGLGQSRSYLSSLGLLASIQLQGDDLPAALVTSQQVLDLNDTLGADDPVAISVNLDRQAEILYGLGRFHDAVAADAKLEENLKNGGAAIPLYIRSHMARRALAAGVPERALTLLSDVLPSAVQSGDDAARLAWPILIEARLVSGDHAGATLEITRYDAATAGSGTPGAREALEAARVRLMLPLAYGSYGRRNPRIAAARTALDAAMQAPGLPRVALLNAHLIAGLGALAAVNAEDARKHAGEALSMAQTASHNPGAPAQASAWVGAAKLLQAKIDVAAGDAAAAETDFAQAREQLEGTVEPQQIWRRDAERVTPRARRPAAPPAPESSSEGPAAPAPQSP